jgi:chromate reductase
MITIICTTNRPDSMTLKMSKIYLGLLGKRGVESQLFSMEEIPERLIADNFYGKNSPELKALVNKYIAPAEKFLVISPEYNGSYPGIFKVFIDAGDVFKSFAEKKAALIGISSGRAGNLRGMDHLTDIFHHLEMEVLSFKIPISRIQDEIDSKGFLTNTITATILEKQIDLFLKF